MSTIQPIVNGSVNPNLTVELFKELPFESQRSVIWNIMVSTEFAHSFKGTDPEIFSKPAEKYDHSSITEDNTIELYQTMRERFNNQHNRLLSRTRDRRYLLGQEIYKVQKELGFGGMLQLDSSRLCGYIKACGSWNDFKAGQVIGAIEKMETVVPKMDYGPNNPNTGHTIHKWKVVHGCEYVIMEFDFISATDFARVKEFYGKHFSPIGSSIKADSIRMEETALDDIGQYYSAELIWWWD